MFAIIGYGRMGHIRKKLAESLGHTCIGIYDPVLGYNDYPNLTSTTDVFVCTPPLFHSENVDRARPASIFVEKPFYDKNVYVGWSHRYHSTIPALKGKVVDYINLSWCRNSGIPGGWFVEKSSAWDDLGLHLVDLASYICDEPFSGVMSQFDFSKGDRKYKSDWWGGDEWNYASKDNAVSVGRCGKTTVSIKVSWANSIEKDEFRISGYLNNGNFNYKIDPFEDIFRLETAQFLLGAKQEQYIPTVVELQ